MHSIRTRITLLTVCVTVIAVCVVTILSVIFIRDTERQKSDQLLRLLCQTGERNLDYYFDSVKNTVDKVYEFAENDLNGLDNDEQLAQHVEHVRSFFEEMAHKTNGVRTFYYRVDPAVSKTVKGFWYVSPDGKEFAEKEATDISSYDTGDISRLVWFTVPKATGQPVWLPPYITENLGVRVISYNVPISLRGRFVGVIGIEVDYSTMADQVDNIHLYKNGYAFLSDAEGNLVYHPRIDVTQMTEETKPGIPEGMVSDNTFIRYTFEGVEKEAAWLRLSNGMRLNVTVPVDETDGDWEPLINQIIIVSVAALVLLIAFTLFFAVRLTRPIQQLTDAARQVDQGNYDCDLDYSRNDEVGQLTHTFQHLVANMRDHISDLNRRAYVDALTSVRNKGAFAAYLEDLQRKVDADDTQKDIAIGIFDCDDLKTINDRYGHEKGDIYLKTSCRLICRIFQHSSVFRIGGDEFAVVMQNDDFRNRDDLVRQFEESAVNIHASAANDWEQAHASIGIAVYNPETDQTFSDTVRRADNTMYANKRARKEMRGK